MKSLVEIVRKNKPSSKPRRYPYYTEVYPQYFDPIRMDEMVILEIGVAMGGSLRAYRDYFSNSKIYGIDSDPATEFSEERIEVFIGHQSDTDFLDSVLEDIGDPDIIIDDGSHRWVDQFRTLIHLFQHAKRLYSVEDLQKDKFKLLPKISDFVAQAEATHLHPKSVMFIKEQTCEYLLPEGLDL